MKKLLGIVVLGLLWCGVSFAFYDNKQLKKECSIAYKIIKSEDEDRESFVSKLSEIEMSDATTCMGYFDGFFETVVMNGVLNKGESKFGAVCFSDKISRNELIEIYYDYIISNRTADDDPAITIIYKSLIKKLPCR